MVEINNQRKAFLDMLAWSEGTDNGRQARNHGCPTCCRRRAIYWLLRSPRKLLRQNSSGAGRYPASLPLVGCLPQAAWPERLLSEKSGRCGIAAD